MMSELKRSLKRLCKFTSRNIREIRQLGFLSALRSKRSSANRHVRSTIIFFAGIPFAIFFIALSRLMSPWRVIRLGSMNTTRLGHLLIDVEMAIAEREMFGDQSRLIDVWFPWRAGLPIVNEHLLEMWKRQVRVLPTWVCSAAYTLNSLLPDGQKYRIPYRKGKKQLSNFNDVNGALRSSSPHLSFLAAEVDDCRSRLAGMGVTPADRIICFHVRSANYLAERLGASNSASHDFRDGSMESHYESMLTVADAGFRVFRMGTERDAPISINHENIIDYACSGMRSELMDLYLPSICEFFVGVLSGPSHIAQLFRRPLLLTNLVPLSRMMLSMENFLFIPKQILYGEGKPLTLAEIIDLNIEDLNNSEEYEQRGLVLKENTSDEIRSAVSEMELRCSGKWVEDNWGVELQQRFLNALPDYLKVGAGNGTISTTYLKENEWFLN